MDKPTQMAALAANIRKQNICPNLAATAKTLVIGKGSLDAKVVFVGEAPGQKEDEKGIPFVGKAGKILDELLNSIGWTIDDVYITNIVKYRRPETRDPRPDEKEAFRPFLDQQLEIIQPKVIAPLGRHSMNIFLPDATIGKAHGKIHFDALGRKIVPLYHPAAAIYNQELKPTLFQDFLTLLKA
jgi:DNA polymerase